MSETFQIILSIEGLNSLSEIESVECRRKILKICAQRYRTFLQERFDRNSDGGGDWKPLKHVRMRNESAAKKGKNQTGRQGILFDTGNLRAALDANMPGSLEEYDVTGDSASVSVGIGGSSPHPSGHASIAEIAMKHHFGDPSRNLPARTIIVPPDEETESYFERIVEKEINKRLKKW